MNRRDFLASLFSGVIVSTVAVNASAVEIYHEHDHYTAKRGMYNIWYVHDEFWYLLSDNQRAPFEFDSESAARDYVVKAGLIEYRVKAPSKEGMVCVRHAPYDIHDMNYLRQTKNQIDEFIIQGNITSEIGMLIAGQMLAAHNGAKQSGIWTNHLEVKAEKPSILKLQNNEYFCKMIRGVYCSNSYHSCLAKLEVFKPPHNIQIVA